MAEIYTDGLDIEPTDIVLGGAPAEDMTEEAYEPKDSNPESDREMVFSAVCQMAFSI